MEVTVSAKENSTAKGTGKLVDVNLKSGEIIIIAANKEDVWGVNDDKAKVTNANGYNSSVTVKGSNQEFRLGSIVGSFNDGKTFFPVGLFTQISVLEGGDAPKLKLYCADSDYENNSGEIRTLITVLSK